MGGVAILKPDHLGDLVLSVPAIRAIRRRHPEVTLMVAPGSMKLARFLFPEIADIRAIAFRHLMRGRLDGIGPEAAARELEGFDLVIILRDDPEMRKILAHIDIPHVVVIANHMWHETALQRDALFPFVGDYSRTRLFSDLPILWPETVEHAALCVAAGFPTNRWPTSYWLELAQLLAREGIAITLVGGPGERDELKLLSRLLVSVPHQVVEGGDDFGGFLEALDPVDLVIASDGGTAHICSLRKPVCSVFGSSPWRRYAPFGQDNVLITRDEPCSPCVQFSSSEINGCLSRECTALLRPSQVAKVVLSNGLDFSFVSGVRVERGVSHRFGRLRGEGAGIKALTFGPIRL